MIRAGEHKKMRLPCVFVTSCGYMLKVSPLLRYLLWFLKFGSCVVVQIIRFGLGSAGSNMWYIY